MATLVPVMYRDACNYKASTAWVFAGEPTPELIGRLRAALDDDGIVAEQVGLENPARQNDIFASRFPDEEDDHGFVEVDVEAIEATRRQTTDSRTFAEFVAACEAVDGWDPDVCIDAVGGWRDPDECAAKRAGRADLCEACKDPDHVVCSMDASCSCCKSTIIQMVEEDR